MRDLPTSKGNAVQYWIVIGNRIQLTGIGTNVVEIVVVEDTCWNAASEYENENKCFTSKAIGGTVEHSSN